MDEAGGRADDVSITGMEIGQFVAVRSPWRRIVEETREPGASVARVAQRYGVNANQVFGGVGYTRAAACKFCRKPR